MNLTYTILKLTDDTYKYQIYIDDILSIDQEFKPFTEGFQSMNLVEAEYWAEFTIDTIKNPPPTPQPEPTGPSQSYTLDGEE